MSSKQRTNQQSAEPADPPAVNASGDGQLRGEIELRAYYRYRDRGCAPGGDVDDWLAAEQEVLAKHGTEASASR